MPCSHGVNGSAWVISDCNQYNIIYIYIYIFFFTVIMNNISPKKKKIQELRAEFIIIVNVARGKSPQDSS